MIINDYSLYISCHDLHLSINDVEILGGYCGGMNLIPGRGPKAIRLYLKKWTGPSMWIHVRASKESWVTHQSSSHGDPSRPPLPKLLFKVRNMDGPSAEKSGTAGNYFPF